MSGSACSTFVSREDEDIAIRDSAGLPRAEFVDKLKEACGTYYGTAGPAFLEGLVRALDDKARDLEILAQNYRDYQDALSTPGMTADERRAVNKLALVATAGATAAYLRIIPFWREEEDEPNIEILSAVEQIKAACCGRLRRGNAPRCGEKR